MGLEELATWAAYYDSEHDERMAREKGRAQWLGLIAWSIFKAAGHKVDLAAFVPAAKPPEIPAHTIEAERRCMAWVAAHGGRIEVTDGMGSRSS